MYFINPNLRVIISPPDEKCGLTTCIALLEFNRYALLAVQLLTMAPPVARVDLKDEPAWKCAFVTHSGTKKPA